MPSLHGCCVQIRWSEDKIEEHIPPGRYRYTKHICVDPDCPIPKTANPAEDAERKYVGIVSPDLSGEGVGHKQAQH